tara:strand:+ start:3154 stop:3375 length:222 start_codon:yes stop_codon:yes gene_type:complete
MIKWLSTAITTPEAGREIIAKNPLKPIGYKSAAKQCKVMKFHPDFTESQIQELMMVDDNLSLWSYTEGECNEQ